MSKHKHNLPYDILSLLITLSVLLIVFQYTTVSKLIILKQDFRFEFFEFVKVIRQVITFTSTDIFIGGGIFLVVITLFVLEIWRKKLSTFLGFIFKSNQHTLLMLIFSSAVVGRYYLAQGAFGWQTDMASHISYCYLASDAIQRGEFPVWTNLLGTGSPFLQFYGFLFFYLVGLVNQIIQDITFSIKVVLFGLHILSSVGMYAFVTQLCNSRQAGFVAGLAYVLCFWHTQQVLILGRLHLSLFYALLPWPFYFFERITKKQTIAIIGGGLTLGLLPFVHPAYGFWATLLLGLYISIRFYSAPAKWRTTYHMYSALGLLALGVVFGAYLTLPMFLERAYVGLEDGVSYAVVADPNWKSLFTWSNYQVYLWGIGNQNWYGGYLGLSLIVLAGAGVIRIIKQKGPRKSSRMLPVCISLIFALILVFGYRWPIIRSVFIFQILAAGRYMLFVTFFLSAMAGVGAHFCLSRVTHTKSLYVTILLLICTDLVPTTFIQPYTPAEIEKRLTHFSPTLYQSLKNETVSTKPNHLPPYRYLYLSDKQMMFLPNTWIPTQIGLPSCFNAYLEAPPATQTYNLPLSNTIQDMLVNQKPPTHIQLPIKAQDILAGGLYALNVRHIFIYAQEKLSHFISEDHSPIIAAPQIVGWQNWVAKNAKKIDPKHEAISLLHHMQIDAKKGSSERIFINGYWPQEERSQIPQMDILSHQVQHQSVDIKINASTDCFIRLAYAYYPYLRICINDQEVTPLETADHFIALKIPKGEQHISIEAYQSPLRRALLILNISILIAACIILYRDHKKAPTQMAHRSH